MGQHTKYRIAIDMTPSRPQGENGGAKILVITLIKQLQILAPNYQFILLTAPWNHAELSAYTTANTQCLLVEPGTPPPDPVAPPQNFFQKVIGKVIGKVSRKLQRSTQPQTYLARQGIDLLFCPFSAPSYAEPGIPTVAILYDLQHLDYPFFFTAEEQQHRTQFLRALIQKSQKIICISEFSRQSLIKHLQAPAEQLAVVHIAIHQRWQAVDPDIMQQQLEALGLTDRPYAFYPANYWPHKNHRFLLTAYSLYRHRYADRAWDLVFTGALASAEAELRTAAATMGLGDHVHFLGFLEESVLTAVWQGCQCLVFPSLYEGFGIPVLEAMMFGKPIITSNAGSLPEVGEDAALYFDPRKPQELVAHWATLHDDPEVSQTLVAKGQQRLQRFGNEVTMTQEYLQIFKAVIQQWQTGGKAI